MKPQQMLQLIKSTNNIIAELDDMLEDDGSQTVKIQEEAKKLREYIQFLQDNIKDKCELF